MDRDVFIANITAAAAAKGEKVTPACKNAGVGTSFVQDVKRGQSPSIEKIIMLANYLGVSVSWLIGDDAPKEPAGQKADELSQEFKSLFADLSPEKREIARTLLKALSDTEGKAP